MINQTAIYYILIVNLSDDNYDYNKIIEMEETRIFKILKNIEEYITIENNINGKKYKLRRLLDGSRRLRNM